MDSYVEQYQAAYREVALHIGIEGAGRKPAHYYITGVPGTAVPAWFRTVLRQKHLRDIARFPYCPAGEIP